MTTKKHIIIIITILLLGLIITGSSYAFWTWNSNVTKSVIFNTSDELKSYIVYDAGESRFVGDFQISSIHTDGTHSTFSVYKTQEAANVTLMATVHISVKDIGITMQNSPALKWTLTEGDSTNPGNVLASGNFIGASAGDILTLASNIEVTTTLTYYTVWVWIDENENPNDAIIGETLNTTVWSEVNQVEASEDRYEITRIGANNQTISATVVDSKYVVTHYAVTTTNNNPSTWTEISSANQNNVYNLTYTANSAGTYYVWFKDANDRVVSASAVVSNIPSDSTGPSCSWGSFTVTRIKNNETSKIDLTCTDTDSGMSVNNIKASDITLSNNYLTITDITGENVTNGFKYTLTLTGGLTDGPVTLTLPANKVKNALGIYNSSAVTSGIINVNNKIEINLSHVTFEYTSTYYNGNSQKPNVTVVVNGVTLIKDTDYTVTYPSNTTDYGSKTVTVTGINNYDGTASSSYYIYKYKPTITISNDSATLNPQETSDFTVRVTSIPQCTGTVVFSSSPKNYVSSVGGNISITADKINTDQPVTAKLLRYTTSVVDLNMYFSPSNSSNCASTTTNYFRITPIDSVPPTGQISANFSGGAINVNLTDLDDGSGSGLVTPYYYRVSTNNVCDSTVTDFVSSNSISYNFTAVNGAPTYYACVKIVDYAGNAAYLSTSVDIRVFLMDMSNYLFRDPSTNNYINSNITSLRVVDGVDVSNAYATYNLSYGSGNTVTGWLINNSLNSSRYDLYIGSDYPLYTLPNIRRGFTHFYDVEDADFGNLNTSLTNDMSSLFCGFAQYSGNLTMNLGNNFDTSNVTNMTGMFSADDCFSIDDCYGPATIVLNLGSKFNTANVTNMTNMFAGFGGNATEVSLNLGNNFDTRNVLNMSGMFQLMGVRTNTYNLDLGNNFDTSNVMNMASMFSGIGQNATFWNLNLGNNFNTAKVTSMSEMFRNAGMFSTTFDLNLNFDTSNVTDMYAMFSGVGQEATTWNLNLGNNFDTSKVTDMSAMFSSAGSTTSVFNLNLGDKFNTSNVVYIENMFESVGGQSVDFNLNLGNSFDVGNVTNTAFMFYLAGANSTNFSLNLGNNFNASKVIDMYSMFSDIGMNAINFSLNLGDNFNASNITYLAGLFSYVGQNATNFSLNLGNNFNCLNAVNMSYMFEAVGYSANNVTLNLGNNFNTSNVTDMSGMFSYMAGANADDWHGEVYTPESLILNLGEHFHTEKVTSMFGMFDHFGPNYKNVDIVFGNYFYTNNVTNMAGMFEWTRFSNSNYLSLLGNHFNTSKVTNMSHMFFNASVDGNMPLKLGNYFYTNNVINMANMFGLFDQVSNHVDLDLGNNFNTINVTNMSHMFWETGLYSTGNVSLNLGNYFDTSNVTNMDYMFCSLGQNDTNFNLNLGNKFNTINVANMAGMFSGLYAANPEANLNFLGNHFDTSNVINMYAMFGRVGFASNTINISFNDKFDTSNVIDMSWMFQYVGANSSNFLLNFGNSFNTSNVKRMSGMFESIGWNTPNFELSLGNNFNTSNVTNMFGMFRNVGKNATNLSINLGNHFNTINVINMATMFYWTGRNVTSLDLNLGNHFNTSNVTNVVSMFESVGYVRLGNLYLNLGNEFDTSKVTNMSWMFSDVGASSTNFSLNLGNKFDTSNVTNMFNMFYDAGYTATNFDIYFGNKLNLSMVSDVRGMFSGTGRVTGNSFNLDLSSGFNTSLMSSRYVNMFRNFGNNKVTIYVGNTTVQDWIIGKNSSWGTNFSASNVLVK